MAHTSELIASDIDEYLRVHQHKSLLRFITCGSVDDGKSTLIGRMLYESHLVFDDHLASLAADSARVGTQGDDLDFALLLDGLAAEREQGITIDVAYRFFSTERRKFIVADTPGHEQYTRNMVTGASTADLAVILIDARKGVLTQTRRHSFLVSLLGIGRVVLAVNKMDLVDYDRSTFSRIEAEYRAFAGAIGLSDLVAIPISALRGANLVAPSPETGWYEGPTLFEHLETVDVEDRAAQAPFRMPVQWVSRPSPDFRGFAGTIVSGGIRRGDDVRVAPAGTASRVASIVTFDGDLDEATAGQSVTVTLTDEVDVSRGDLLCAAGAPPLVAERFEAHVVWFADEPQVPGRSYLVKLGARVVTGALAAPSCRIDVNTLERLAGGAGLATNEIGVCEVSLDRPVAFDPYRDNRGTGGFIVIDRLTNATVAAGMADAQPAARRDTVAPSPALDRSVGARPGATASAVVWLDGPAGPELSALAAALDAHLRARGVRTYLLDPDLSAWALGSGRDAGTGGIRRIATLLAGAGFVVICAPDAVAEDDPPPVQPAALGAVHELAVEVGGPAGAPTSPGATRLRVHPSTDGTAAVVSSIVDTLARRGALGQRTRLDG